LEHDEIIEYIVIGLGPVVGGSVLDAIMPILSSNLQRDKDAELRSKFLTLLSRLMMDADGTLNSSQRYYYLHQGGNVFARLCLSVCLCVSKITQKIMDGSFLNFLGMSGIAKTTSDSIFAVIRKESWILDHFEIFVSIAFNGA